jgi:hypothetical protein
MQCQSKGTHEGTPFGRQSFSYWDEKALVHQTLQSFDGQELEIMERLSISPQRTKLSCVLELSSGGLTVNHMLREKASLHEGHGFSRAIKGLPTTALAAEVRFSTHTRQRHLSPRLSSPQTIGKTYLRG